MLIKGTDAHRKYVDIYIEYLKMFMQFELQKNIRVK